MSHTQRHVALGVAWFFGYPLLVIALILLGAIPFSEFHGVVLSATWGIGLASVFGVWSFADAPQYGKPILVAAVFTVAWFVVFVLAVFPYLFVTRGAKLGLLASLRFIGLVVACLVGWVGLLPLVGGVQYLIELLAGGA